MVRKGSKNCILQMNIQYSHLIVSGPPLNLPLKIDPEWSMLTYFQFDSRQPIW